MLLYVIRHGEAEAPTKGGSAAHEESHLTADGRRWVAEVVSLAHKELGFNPDQILSSPLPRARETAEIVHRTLGTKSDVAIEESLLADADAKDVYKALRTWKGAEGPPS